MIDEIQRINSQVYVQSNKFGGNWLIEEFQLSPGPQIGAILKSLYSQFGDNLDEQSEEDVRSTVEALLKQ